MAGSITQSHAKLGNIRIVTFTCTADGSDGSFPETAITDKIEGRLIQLVTNPGSTGPQSNYDIVLDDAEALDTLQGVGANRHTSTTEVAVIVFSGSTVHPVVDESDTLTLKITNNNVNSATIVIKLYYALGS